MQKIILTTLMFTIFALSSFGVDAGVDTIYYDKQWKGVSNRHFADFYRIIEKNPAPGYPKKFRDFFITGEMQGEGIYDTIDRYDDSKTVFGDGEFIWYYKNGQISKRHKIINRQIDGEYAEFYESGQPKKKWFFLNGKPQGECINYYENGKIKDKQNFKNGEYDGVFESYYENGDPARQAHFSNGKMNGLYTEVREDGLWYQQEYKNGEPATDYYVVTNKDGLYSRVRRSDNSPIYESPSVNTKQVTKVDDILWSYYANDGVMVYITCYNTNDYGKYHRVYIHIANNSFTPMLFNPANTDAILTDSKGNRLALEIQTAQEYSNRIGRTHMWEEGFAALGENAAANKSAYSKSTTVTRGNNGKATISNTTTYDANAANAAQAQANQNIANLKQANKNQRDSKVENYVRKVTINPGQVYEGYFNIKRKNDGNLNITLDVGGAKYQFPISVTK